MLVAIPSKGRPHKATSAKRLPSAVLYVPAAEAAEYRKHNTNEIVPVPDDVRGITLTRNWILDNTEHDWVVFIDDDVQAAGYVRMNHSKCEHVPMGEAQFLFEWRRLFELTEDLGYRIWGTATISAPRAVYPYRPFIFHTYVTASCMGVRNDTGIRFDNSFPVKEDYEICLRCIKEDGGVLGARYFYWQNSHWVDPGGCRDYRTGVMEAECIDRLLEMYPGMIRRVTRQGTDYSIELEF